MAAERRRTVLRPSARLHSAAMDRGLNVELPLLALRNVVVAVQGMRLACDEVAAVLGLRIDVDGAQVSYTLDIASVTLTGLRVLKG